MWLLTSSPILGLTTDVIVQAMTARRLSVGHSIVAGASAGFVVTAAVTLRGVSSSATFADQDAIWIVSIATFLALAFDYWMFLNLNITSLRIRVLRELAAEKDGLALATIRERYPSHEVLARRLNRLERAGQMVKIEGRWHLRSRALVVLLAMLAVLRAFAIPSRSLIPANASEPGSRSATNR